MGEPTKPTDEETARELVCPCSIRARTHSKVCEVKYVVVLSLLKAAGETVSLRSQVAALMAERDEGAGREKLAVELLGRTVTRINELRPRVTALEGRLSKSVVLLRDLLGCFHAAEDPSSYYGGGGQEECEATVESARAFLASQLPTGSGK